MLQLIDRRPNSRGKSAVNRERFLRRYKAQIQGAVKKMIGERRIADMEKGGEVRVPKKDIWEPSFGFGHGGDREFVLPGNREFVAGDRIARPQGGGSGGNRGSAGEGDSEDAIVRTLRQSLARRIALGGSLAREIMALETDFAIASAAGQAERAAQIYAEL